MTLKNSTQALMGRCNTWDNGKKVIIVIVINIINKRKQLLLVVSILLLLEAETMTHRHHFQDINTIIEQSCFKLTGVPKYPDLKTYSKEVGFEDYNTFLILSASRLTQNDLLLAEKVKSMKKSFFFVRTKIDVDVHSQKRKRTFDEDVMLRSIRSRCLENLKMVGLKDNDVFLISNLEPAKWDFGRLTGAILDGLPDRLKESLTLSLDLMTTKSKDILKRKADALRGSYREHILNFIHVINLHKLKPYNYGTL